MHTVSRPLVAAAFALLIAGTAFAQVSLTVGNAGFESGITAGLPTTAGSWEGDLNSVTTAENGVTPYAGSQMLRFQTMAVNGSDVGTGSDTFQLVDLNAYASNIAAGNFTVTLSAYYNRSHPSYDTFQTVIRSYSGSLASFPTDINSSTAMQFSNLISDTNTATWELGTVSLTVPTNTTYIAIFVSAITPINVGSIPSGYYADNVSLTAVPEPSAYAALAGVAALGLAIWRRRRAVTA